jgi:GTP-binding protein
VSDATPKVGAYPFTTLEPYLGVVEVGYETLVLADIPGLIEGAHAGAGLGTAFLQHIRRTEVLIHVVDVAEGQPVESIGIVRGELAAYGHGLEAKPWLVALNKIDLPRADEEARAARAKLRQTGVTAVPTSAVTGQGIEELMSAALALVRERKGSRDEPEPEQVTIRRDGGFEVKVAGRSFRVLGEQPVTAAAKLGVDSEEAVAELVRRLRRMGVVAALKRAGIADGDRVRIGDVELAWPL